MSAVLAVEPCSEGDEEAVTGSERARSCLTVMANRLPVHQGEDGRWGVSPGGLVSALMPVLRSRRGQWIGWGGIPEGRVDGTEGICLLDVPIGEEEFSLYYGGVANGILWPLFHDRLRQPDFSHEAWRAYRRVNKRFAERAAGSCPPGSAVWVQDYHLLLTPGMLRRLRPDLRIGLFLHTPVPPSSLFLELPWRDEIIRSLRQADCIGTQTEEDREHLLGVLGCSGQDDERRVGAFPISIDSRRYEDAARRAEAEGAVRRVVSDLGEDRTIFLGVDRLDYTKGLDQRLKALEHAFRTGMLDPGKVRFLQVAVPSRREVDDYEKIGESVDMLVGRINGTYSGVGDPVIHYHRRSMSGDDLAALYRAADVMVVTPLRDGMNLVAKEYVASRFDGTGELILSEFAGASRELSSATLVNPNDIEAIAAAFAGAHRRRDRSAPRAEMREMHRQVMEADVFRWSGRFLKALADAPAGAGRAGVRAGG